MYVLLTLGACAVGTVTIMLLPAFYCLLITILYKGHEYQIKSNQIIVDAGHRAFSRLGELSTDADNSGFFSIRRVCMVSYRSNKRTGSSLIGAQWQC